MSNLKKLVRARMSETGESYQTALRHVTLRPRTERLLREAGVPDDVLRRWCGTLLGFHQFNIGLGATIEAAREHIRANKGRYTLDLGHYQMGLSETVGDALKAAFAREQVKYTPTNVKMEWYRRKWPHAFGRRVQPQA